MKANCEHIILTSFCHLQMWCMTETTEYLRTMREKGNHPPGRYRVIGPVSNMKEFGVAFNCPGGSYMNPDDNKRCVLW